jgi:hypothetical protein
MTIPPSPDPAAQPGPARIRSMASFVGPGRATPAAGLQLDDQLYKRLAARLTGRDRFVLSMLHEHRVLTVPQIVQLAFPSVRAANHRLLTLYQHRALERFRPRTTLGSAPHHYLLGPAGAAILTQQQRPPDHQHTLAINAAASGYRAEHILALAHSPVLAHLVGANGVFTALAAHARHTAGCELERWWSERRCAHTFGHLTRPDGYGRWRQAQTRVDFFLEYDTGTEPLARLIAKLDGYTHLAATNTLPGAVLLFALPAPTRETHLHALLRPHHSSYPITIATCVGDPTGPAWLPVGSRVRRRLAELAAGTDSPARAGTGG